MKQIILFLVVFTIMLSPLGVSAELNLTAPNTSNITNMLPGPATDIFKLLEGLKTDIEAKMGLMVPKIDQSGGYLKNLIRRETGQITPDIISSGKDLIQEKISYFNSQSFISTSTEFLKGVFMWLIEIVRKAINYF
ncbi:MAG: hypothetical protein WCV80_03640 [Candidatus Paceibacterota bacterium]|jgi:hypothetical protein